ncbi:MAG: FecR domain-containing protein, partial [Myxococcota bacterium]
MDELSQTLQQLGQAIRHEVDEHQLEEGLQNVHRIHHRRRRRNQGLAAVAGTAALILVVGLGWRHLGTPGEDPQVYATYEPIRLGLGTQATPLTQDTQVRVIQVQPERLALTLPRGSARFSVEPNPSRTVHLTVGHVQIDVLGTTFTVERQPGRVRVDVDKGRVRVRWPEGERILKDQEGGWFSNPAAQTAQPHEGPSVAAEEADTTQEPSQTEPSDDVDLVAGAQAPQPQTEPSRAAQAPGARRRWQTLAKSGDYKGAFEVMKRAPTVRDVP